MAYKMKGSPMHRNFGVGSPMKNEKEYTDEQQRAINRGKIANFNRDNPKASEKEMNAYIQKLMSESGQKSTEKKAPIEKSSPAKGGLKHFTYNERPRR